MALIKGKQLAAATISSSKIADDAITTAKIANSAVQAAKIYAGAVTTAKIADSNVTTAKIADANVTFAKLHADAVASASEGLGTADNMIPTSAAVKEYVDSVAQGLDIKASVRVATTSNATLASDFEDGDSLNGVSLVAGDRILIKNQTNQTENGIYTVNASGSPTRASDADTSDHLTSGSFVFVEDGGQANTGWVLTTTGSITLGTTNIAFSQFSESGSSTLGAITDVSLNSPGTDHVLVYSGSSWSNATISSFVDLEDLGDVTYDGTPSNNQFLRYDSTTSRWKNQTVSIGSTQEQKIEIVGDSSNNIGVAQTSGTATIKTTEEITLAGNVVSQLSNGDYVEVTSTGNTGIDVTDIQNAGMTFVTQATGSSVDVPQGAILEVTTASNLNNAAVNGLKIARIYTPGSNIDASKVNLFFNGIRQTLSTNLDGFGFRKRNAAATSGFASSDTTAGLIHGQDFLVYTVTSSIELETDDQIVVTYVV